jgi:RNA polymerase sigma-70 factor (ECF subfamily)
MVVHEDVVLVRRCVEGDREAFSGLVDKYKKVVYNAAYRITGNLDDANDVTQTVFLRAYEHLHRYSPRYKFFSWLYKIAVNESINLCNRRKSHEEVREDVVGGHHDGYDDGDRAERQQGVEAALLELTDDYRVVIVLFHLQELSYQEISYILDVPVKTVKSRLYTARQQLKEILKRKGFDL